METALLVSSCFLLCLLLHYSANGLLSAPAYMHHVNATR
jgi:hypothetical protein